MYRGTNLENIPATYNVFITFAAAITKRMKRFTSIGYDILAVMIVAIWGMTFISTSVLLRYMEPAQIFFIRFAIAYAGIWFFAHECLFSDSWKDELRMALAGIMGGSLYFLAENTALKVSQQASSISFIVCTTPLVTAIVAVLLKHKGAKMTTPLAIGSAVALLGIGLIMFNGSAFFGAPILGYLLAMVASLTWAFYTIIISDLTDKYGSAFISRKVFFYGILTILPVLFAEDLHFNIDIFKIPAVWGNVIFLSVVASLGCYALWTPVIKKLGTIKSSNYIYLNPVFTLAGSVLLLNEKITWISAAGSLITLFGVWLASRKFTLRRISSHSR